MESRGYSFRTISSLRVRLCRYDASSGRLLLLAVSRSALDRLIASREDLRAKIFRLCLRTVRRLVFRLLLWRSRLSLVESRVARLLALTDVETSHQRTCRLGILVAPFHPVRFCGFLTFCVARYRLSHRITRALCHGSIVLRRDSLY